MSMLFCSAMAGAKGAGTFSGLTTRVLISALKLFHLAGDQIVTGNWTSALGQCRSDERRVTPRCEPGIILSRQLLICEWSEFIERRRAGASEKWTMSSAQNKPERRSRLPARVVNKWANELEGSIKVEWCASSMSTAWTLTHWGAYTAFYRKPRPATSPHLTSPRTHAQL
jgi:hypothetical protein